MKEIIVKVTDLNLLKEYVTEEDFSCLQMMSGHFNIALSQRSFVESIINIDSTDPEYYFTFRMFKSDKKHISKNYILLVFRRKSKLFFEVSKVFSIDFYRSNPNYDVLKQEYSITAEGKIRREITFTPESNKSLLVTERAIEQEYIDAAKAHAPKAKLKVVTVKEPPKEIVKPIKPKSPRYYHGTNNCSCHPETCCCDPYAIFDSETVGDNAFRHKKILTVFTEEKAIEIADLYNKEDLFKNN